MKHSKNSSPLNLNGAAQNRKRPRNSFDMSYHTYFTSPVGAILPIYVQDVQPGDYLKINVSNFCRTQPVNTSAFARISENVDFYFVPYRLLWRYFNQFYTGIQDYQTSYIPEFNPNNENTLTIFNQIPAISPSYIVAQYAKTTETDMMGYNKNAGMTRLLDLLGYSTTNTSDLTPAGWWSKFNADPMNKASFNPFRILAYQYLWFKYYRENNYTPNNPAFFNIDDITGPTIEDRNRSFNIFELRYKTWSKDRFTAIRPTPLSTLSSSSTIPSTVKPSGEGIQKENLNQVNNITSVTGSVSDAIAVTRIQNIRAALAMDRLARITSLNNKDYGAQIKAHFGVTPDRCSYCDPTYLGSHKSNLDIGEVTATSTGAAGESSNVLGQIAGKGISYGKTNRPISYSVDEPGVILGLHYLMPESEYDSNRIDDFNTKLGRSDYFIPEYDNLGLQPLYNKNFVIDGSTTYPTLNNVLGYQARYLEYKTRVDEVHGEFQSGMSLSFWTIPRKITNVKTLQTYASDLYINPNVTDSIFALNYSGYAASDPFLCHFRYDVTKVSDMSVYGIPVD